MLDANLDKILNTFGERVTKLARINLGRSNKGRRIDSSGKLRKSLGYKLDKNKNDVTFSFQDYGIFVDAGVVGKKNRILKDWNKSLFKRGRYRNKPPPFEAIRKWIDDKPIRPRNLSSGRFVVSKDTDIKDRMAGAIRMSIYLKGKQPTLFFSNPFNDEFKKLPDDIAGAFGKDIDNDLKK